MQHFRRLGDCPGDRPVGLPSVAGARTAGDRDDEAAMKEVELQKMFKENCGDGDFAYDDDGEGDKLCEGLRERAEGRGPGRRGREYRLRESPE